MTLKLTFEHLEGDDCDALFIIGDQSSKGFEFQTSIDRTDSDGASQGAIAVLRALESGASEVRFVSTDDYDFVFTKK